METTELERWNELIANLKRWETEPRSERIVDVLMERHKGAPMNFCEAEACACSGCLNLVVSRKEFELWKERHNFCECCQRYN